MLNRQSLHLADLKKPGFVKTSGNKRSTRYYYALPRIVKSGSDIEKTTQSKDTSLLPLSEEGQEIRLLVLLPELRRKPVGYNREFLENYQPNIDSYKPPFCFFAPALLQGIYIIKKQDIRLL